MATTNQFNPNTGKPLAPGETVQIGNTGTYVTGGQVGTTTKPPTPVFSAPAASTPKPTGLATINKTLTVGSQDPVQVKALQTWLRDTQGATNADGTPLKVDGLYGPNTKTAVMQFQSNNGLVVDGIFGPKSLAGANNIANTSAQSNVPLNYDTGNQVQNDLLQQSQDYATKQISDGLKIDPNRVFSAEDLTGFMDAAKFQVHPFYQQQIDTIKQDVARQAPQILQNYQKDIQAKQQGFQKDLGDTRNALAGQGMAYSGFRGQQEKALQDTTNRSLYDLTQGAGNDLYKLGRTAEEQISSSNMPSSLGSLGNYTASLGGQGGFTLGGTTSPYQSGGFKIGQTQQDEAAAAEVRRQALLQTAGNAVNAGRSYQDLTSA